MAGFTGDLFALDLLPVWMVHDRIISNLAYPNQVSTVHCRALHLFLLHAKAHIGPSIGPDVLGGIRRQLVRCARGPPIAYDRMAQLWVIVSCIDQDCSDALLTTYSRSVVRSSTRRWNRIVLDVKTMGNWESRRISGKECSQRMAGSLTLSRNLSWASSWDNLTTRCNVYFMCVDMHVLLESN